MINLTNCMTRENLILILKTGLITELFWITLVKYEKMKRVDMKEMKSFDIKTSTILW